MRSIRGMVVVAFAAAAVVATVAIAAVGVSPAGACSLALPSVIVSGDSTIAPGDPLSIEAFLFDLVPATETTTTTTQAGDPEIADCPPIQAVAEVTFRFVQGEFVTDVAVVEPTETRFTQAVVVPASARSGPATIVAVVDGEAVATSEAFSVTTPVSPPAPPTVDEPAFTG